MTATEIIRQIEALNPSELAAVVRHTKEIGETRPLSPEELGVLLDQFIEATDPEVVERLNQEITTGFYGRR